MSTKSCVYVLLPSGRRSLRHLLRHRQPNIFPASRSRDWRRFQPQRPPLPVRSHTMSRIWVGVHSSLRDVEMGTNITAANVQLKRAYERPAHGDGTRILVDRLWPRGMTKKAAAIDEWLKDISPST